MSKESSKRLFEWYAQVAEKKLQAIKQGAETYKDCKTREQFSNYMLNVFITYHGLRCTCADGMDWDFNHARGHYHHCDLYKFCHIVERSLDWAEHQDIGCGSAKEKDDCGCGHKKQKHSADGCQVVHTEGDDDVFCACEKVYPSKAQELEVGCEKGSVTSADKTRQKGMCAVTRKVKSAVNRSAHRIPNSPSQVPKEEDERREE